jgi:SAM-dependent methyltransferase
MMSALTAISKFFRTRRMRRLLQNFPITSQTRHLDVGGVPEFWDLLSQHPFLVLLNLHAIKGDLGRGTFAVVGNAQFLPFGDSSFDLVVSNSVIEHVGDRQCQERFAQEVARVGRNYWIQTPNLWFPIEQHLFLPIIHWLPLSWQAPIVRRFTLWSLMRVSQDRRDYYAEHYIRDIRLLGSADLRRLFPAAHILRESAFGWTKCLIAVSRLPR